MMMICDIPRATWPCCHKVIDHREKTCDGMNPHSRCPWPLFLGDIIHWPRGICGDCIARHAKAIARERKRITRETEVRNERGVNRVPSQVSDELYNEIEWRGQRVTRESPEVQIKTESWMEDSIIRSNDKEKGRSPLTKGKETTSSTIYPTPAVQKWNDSISPEILFFANDKEELTTSSGESRWSRTVL